MKYEKYSNEEKLKYYESKINTQIGEYISSKDKSVLRRLEFSLKRYHQLERNIYFQGTPTEEVPLLS